MPRINRRRRVQKVLTDETREELLYGYSFSRPQKLIRLDADADDDYVAVTDPKKLAGRLAELKSLWLRHRLEIMGEHKPGSRPWGYLRFDLRIDKPPSHWTAQLELLLDRGLIDPDEAALIDSGDYPELRADTSLSYCQGFADPERIRGMRLGVSALNTAAMEFQAAARWHQYRGRRELAALWAKRVEATRGALQDTVLASGQETAGARGARLRHG